MAKYISLHGQLTYEYNALPTIPKIHRLKRRRTNARENHTSDAIPRAIPARETLRPMSMSHQLFLDFSPLM